MPSYKLCYFNARGFGEVCRILMAEAGVSYEDVRYTQEEWPKHKPDMLFNQMPVLFVDGEQIAHSRAAFRYLARELKMEGDYPLASAKLDMWMEVLTENFLKFPFRETDEKKKAEQAEIVLKENFFPKFKILEATINESKGTYIYGDKLTALEILVYTMLDAFKNYANLTYDDYPKLSALLKAVETRPNIAKWLKERPVTEN